MARKSFKLPYGPHQIEVRFEDLALDALNGQSFFDNLLIKLDVDLTGSRLREVLIHECVHTVSSANSLDLNEQQVRALGLGLAQMLERFIDLEDIDHE